MTAEPSNIVYRWGHRPVLTQIRFVAVTLVLLFHAGLIDRGFIGVDIFFVLSGFLITNVLWESLADTGSIRLTLTSFYLRRMKRLLPLAIVVLAATTLAAWAWFDTTIDELSSSVRASALWFQNWNLIGEDADYFTPDGTNPFTHFWSLSIEEQFYLALPVVLLGALWGCRRRPERVRVMVVGALAAGGVALSLAANLSWDGPEVGRYYATHTRAYQLLLGVGAMALVRLVRVRPSPRACGVALGALMVLALVPFGSLLTVGIAAALLATVVVVTGEGLTSRRPVLEHLGELSYGVYLWHFPINEYLRVEEGRPAWVVFVATFAASHLLSEVTHRAVERPIRRARDIVPRRVLAIAIPVVVLVVLLPTVVGLDRETEVVAVQPLSASSAAVAVQPAVQTSVQPLVATTAPLASLLEESSATTTAIVADTHEGPLREQYESVPVEGTSIFTCGVDDLRESCIDVDTEGGARVMLLGDSFSERFYPALHTLAIEQGWQFSTFTRRGCPWQFDVFQNFGNQFTEPCRRSKSVFPSVIEEVEPEVVIVHGFPYFANEQQRMTSAETGQSLTADDFLDRTFETIGFLNDEGIEVIAIETTPMPSDGQSVLTCVRANDHLAAGCEFSYAHAADGYDQALREHAAENPSFSYVTVNDWWCDGSDCKAGFRGHLVMADLTHTSSSMLLESRSDLLNLLYGTGAFDG